MECGVTEVVDNIFISDIIKKNICMYDYKNFKKYTFTNEGQVQLLSIRDNIKKIVKKSGVITMRKAIEANGSGDSHERMSCVDHLVKLGELKEIKQGRYTAGQDRIFVSIKKKK